MLSTSMSLRDRSLLPEHLITRVLHTEPSPTGGVAGAGPGEREQLCVNGRPFNPGSDFSLSNRIQLTVPLDFPPDRLEARLTSLGDKHKVAS